MIPYYFFLTANGLCALPYALQLAYLGWVHPTSAAPRDSKTRKTAYLLRICPVICCILSLIVCVIISIDAGNLVRRHQDGLLLANSTGCESQMEINPDIGGIGVLLSLFLPCFALLLVLVSSHFKSETSGAKEVCLAQCANLLCLTINLAKAILSQTLNHRNLLIAISSVDAVSASVSMSFSDKDVLAARKLVTVGFLTQLAALGVEGAALDSLSHITESHCAFTLSQRLFPPNSSTLLWVYWAFRVIAATCPGPIARRLASNLNKIENRNKESRSMGVTAKRLWTTLPATLCTNYWIYFSFLILHGALILTVLHETTTTTGIRVKFWGEWGQVASLVLAVYSICHVIYGVWRLFTAEAVRDRARVAREDGGSVSWGDPVEPWMTRQFLKTLGQRSPFGKIRIDYPDHLLVNEAKLERVLKPPPVLDQRVQDKLLEKLFLGFKYHEPEMIIDSLREGCPRHLPNERGEYPIHLAAKTNNEELLIWTRFKPTDSPLKEESLFKQNVASETPLEVAVNADTIDAVRWIMEKLPQTQAEAKDAVCKAFKSAILAEKEDILKVLLHLWPDWRTMKLQGRDKKELSLFFFSLESEKDKAAIILTDPEILVHKDPTSRRTFELARKTRSRDLIRRTLDGTPSSLSDDTAVYVIIDSQLSDNEALELSHRFNLDNKELLFQAVERAPIGDHSLEGHWKWRPSLWQLVLRTGEEIKPSTLDSVLTFLSSSKGLSSHVSESRRKVEYMIKQALLKRGALDWSELHNALNSGDLELLTRLVKAEEDKKDKEGLKRMYAVTDRTGNFFIGRVIIDLRTEEPTEVYEHVVFLVELGVPVRLRDLESALMSFVPTNAFELLVEHTNGVVTDVLQVCFREIERFGGFGSDCWFQKAKILLRHDADPTSKDCFGKTPRENLAVYFEKAKDLFNRAESSGRRSREWAVRGRNRIEVRLKHILDLLQRWERYHEDPSSGRPSD